MTSRTVSIEGEGTITVRLSFAKGGVLYEVKLGPGPTQWSDKRPLDANVAIGVCTTEFEINVPISATGTFVPGAPEVGPRYGHGGLPADPPEVEDLCVSFEGLNITEALPEGDAELIFDAMISKAEDESSDNDDNDDDGDD